MSEEERVKNFYGDEPNSQEEKYIDCFKSNNEIESNDISFNTELSAILKDNNDNNDYRCNGCLLFPYIEIKDKNTMNYICRCNDFKRKQIAIKDFLNNKISFQKKKTKDNIYQLKCVNHNKKFRYYCSNRSCRRNICKKCCESDLKKGHTQDLINFDFYNFDASNKINKIIVFFNSKVKKTNEIKSNNKSDISELKENSSILQDNLISDELKKDVNSYKIIIDEKNSKALLEENNIYYFYKLFQIIYINYLKYPNNAHYFNIENLFRYLEKIIDVKDNNETQKNDESNNNEIKEIKNFVKEGKYMMTLKYKNDNSSIKLFSDKFVQNYIKKVYLEIDNKFVDIIEYCKFEPNIKEVEIKLYVPESLKQIDMSSMFNDCENLKSVDGVSKWKKIKIIGLDGIFNNCKSLTDLPDISDWNIKEIRNISLMFYNCYSLSKLPDLSKWFQKNRFLKDKTKHLVFFGFSFPRNSEEVKYINNKRQENLNKINIENNDKNEKEKIEKILEPYKNKIKMLEEKLNKKNEVMQIFVKTLTGKITTVDFEPLFTVENVKEIIKNKENIPIDQQRFLYNGHELLNDKTLTYYNIQRDSTIHLILKYRLPRKDMNIFVKIVLNGKILTLDVEKSDTIQNVKAQIQNIEGIPIDQQTLLFSGYKLENNKTLSDCKIQKYATLLLIKGGGKKK